MSLARELERLKRLRLTVVDEDGETYETLVVTQLPRRMWDGQAQIFLQSFLAQHRLELVSVRRVEELAIEISNTTSNALTDYASTAQGANSRLLAKPRFEPIA